MIELMLYFRPKGKKKLFLCFTGAYIFPVLYYSISKILSCHSQLAINKLLKIFLKLTSLFAKYIPCILLNMNNFNVTAY